MESVMQRVLVVSKTHHLYHLISPLLDALSWDITTTLHFSPIQINENFDLVLMLDVNVNIVLSPEFNQLDMAFPNTPICIILIKNGSSPIRPLGPLRWIFQISETSIPTVTEFHDTIQTLQPPSNVPSKKHTPKPHASLLNKKDKKNLIVIGSSTGGVEVLINIVSNLPDHYTIPTIIVHHLPPNFESTLCNMLQRHTSIPVAIIEDQMPIESKIYIAPYDFHVEVDESFVAFQSQPFFTLNQNPKEHFMRPAIDPLFKSVATLSQHRISGFILTGMGHDGADGCSAILAQGGQIWVQDKQSSAVWGMAQSVQTQIPEVQTLTPNQIIEYMSTLSISVAS